MGSIAGVMGTALSLAAWAGDPPALAETAASTTRTPSNEVTYRQSDPVGPAPSSAAETGDIVATRPTSAGPPQAARITQVRLPLVGRPDGRYWLRTPAGHQAGNHPPLLICLHGTDDTARDALDFWSARRARVPLLIVAPQGPGPGWSDADVPFIRAMLADLQSRASYDADRVLLAGFSAGGSMALHLLYEEKLPLTAVAALGNYVPPYITADDVRARREVPVFYAVGMTDVNHERMRSGIALLRSAGGNIYLHRPPIGHVLDADVGQDALNWFFDRCAMRILRMLEEMSKPPDLARAVIQLEAMILQAAWHEPDHIQLAARALERLEAEGQRELDEARALAPAGRPLDAVDALAAFEDRYGPTQLARQAREARQRLEADPHIHTLVEARETKRRTEHAMSLYAEAQRLVAHNRFSEAAANCRHILAAYAETPAAVRARTLLDILEKRVPRERLQPGH